MSELNNYINFLNQINNGKDENEFENALRSHTEFLKSSIKDSKVVNDSYGNSILSVGNDDEIEKYDEYSFDNNTLNWTLWMSLYNDSWVFRRAIDKPAQDEVRCGITLTGNQDKSEIIDSYNRHRFDFIQLLQWGALFGGSIGVIQFDGMTDAETLSKPLDYSKVDKNKLKNMRIYTVDRWYGVAPSTELVESMSSLDYGKPKYYDVTFADGKSYRVHHSFVLRYEHRTAPKLVKNGQLQGWGYAEGAHIIHEIMRDEKLKASVQSLVNKALIEVIKMPGMRGVFLGADKDNQNQLEQRLQMVNWARNYNALTFLDKEDEYDMKGFNGLNGLSDLLEKNMWLISAALEMQGVLYGDLKQGFSNDSNALERYDQTINGRCESYFRPVVEKYLTIMYKIYNINEEVSFTFNSLLAEKQLNDKVDNISKFVDVCGKMLNDGVITPQQYAKAVQMYSIKGEVDFGLTDEAIDKLNDDIEEQIEGIDLSGGSDGTIV